MKSLVNTFVTPAYEQIYYIIRRGAFYMLLGSIVAMSVSGLVEITGESHIVESHAYGPTEVQYQIPKKPSVIVHETYDFTKVQAFNGKLGTRFISGVQKQELINHLLMATPKSIRKRAIIYMEDILFFSEKYGLDPLWSLAVIWTESHFRPTAKSHVSATGLMQIMPNTGKFLNKLLKRPNNKALVRQLLVDPRTNIELGTFYLKRLLKRFHSHRFATVAYNMGPKFVSRRLRGNRPVGTNNRYWDKVKKYYSVLLTGVQKLEDQSRKDGLESLLLRKSDSIDTRYYLGHDILVSLLRKYSMAK